MSKIIGVNPVIEALKSGIKIEKIEIFTGIKKETLNLIKKYIGKRNIKINMVNKRAENSQGLVAYIENFDRYKTIEEFLEKELIKEKSTIIILDQIQDPRNFGAIIRSAECFGVKGIVIQDRNSVKVTETVIKASVGAIEYIDIIRVTNISDTIDLLKKYGYFVYGSSSYAENSYNKVDYADKKVLVLGNEGSGMRKKVSEHCDMNVKIELKGEVNSLNVSVACGILLAEMTK